MKNIFSSFNPRISVECISLNEANHLKHCSIRTFSRHAIDLKSQSDNKISKYPKRKDGQQIRDAEDVKEYKRLSKQHIPIFR